MFSPRSARFPLTHGWITLLIFVATLLSQARAHTGMENESSVQLRPNRLSILTRTTPQLAWQLLGASAPTGPLDQAFDKARPSLEKLAAKLFTIRSGNTQITPTSVRVVLEPDRHLAFALTYPPLPENSTLSLSAPFLSKLGNREPATLKFYDYRTPPHPARPFATLELHRATQSLHFSHHSADLDPS